MRPLSLSSSQNAIDEGHDISNKIHVVQDTYNEELKRYLEVPNKENQTSISNSIATLRILTGEKNTLK